MKEGGTRYSVADVVVQANNGVMQLFSNVKYELAGQEIECVNNPGIAGVLIGYCKISLQLRVWNWNDPMLITRNIGWCVVGKSFHEMEGVYHRELRPHGLFSFAIELENLFGF